MSNRTVDRDFQNRIYDTLFEVELETDQVLTGIVQNLRIWNDFKMTTFYQNVLRDGVEL